MLASVLGTFQVGGYRCRGHTVDECGGIGVQRPARALPVALEGTVGSPQGAGGGGIDMQQDRQVGAVGALEAEVQAVEPHVAVPCVHEVHVGGYQARPRCGRQQLRSGEGECLHGGQRRRAVTLHQAFD